MNKKVLYFIRNKTIHFILLMIAVAIFNFILIDLSPIDPVNIYLQQSSVSEAQRAALEQYWGVGQPITTKIWNWLINLLQGNLGTSLIYRVPVSQVIIEKFEASVVLMLLSWLISGLIGFFLGVVAGKNRDSWIDKIIKIYCYILQSAPSFWIGLLILIIFGVELGWFPIGLGVPIGTMESNVTIWQWLARLVLPVLTLSLVGVAPIAMYTRNELVEVLSSDYVLFAKARGEFGWPLIERQALRNILLPALTLQFLSFSELFGGAVLVEQVFSYPGIGQTAVAAGLQSDVPLLLGIVLVSAVFVFVGNLIADILYYFVDPRTKENESFDV
ncbi:ABC transporter permease [Methanobrevibacter sp. 87.7]|uniref:ABC transporter permease n=1 Tax=Methanobrevibacter sp. 87.7 TaxID=387957 RepID=UPI000B50FD65|nr:ABC transporter permease [Methanobrevibacter sp. 87.7]OWT33784.1 ABC transporter permease [Methanobrevibacter sp. 87.7]